MKEQTKRKIDRIMILDHECIKVNWVNGFFDIMLREELFGVKDEEKNQKQSIQTIQNEG